VARFLSSKPGYKHEAPLGLEPKILTRYLLFHLQHLNGNANFNVLLCLLPVAYCLLLLPLLLGPLFPHFPDNNVYNQCLSASGRHPNFNSLEAFYRFIEC
jgi:hypothetical protein